MRLFPVIFTSRRVCTESTVLKNTKTGRSLKVPKGMIVHLPQYHIMVDENYYELPFDFMPERFLEENGGVKKYMDMGTYWGYGAGPRVCLGIKAYCFFKIFFIKSFFFCEKAFVLAWRK